MENEEYYLCPACFKVYESPGECHGQATVCCFVGPWGSYLRKPVTGPQGDLVSRAPRWYLEAVGWMQAYGRYTPYP